MLNSRATNSDASQSSSGGLAGVPPSLPKSLGRLLQAFAEVPLPEPVHRHAGEQRILRRGQPVGERLDAALAKIDLRRRERPAGLDRMILFGPLRIAAGQDVALLLLACRDRLPRSRMPASRRRGRRRPPPPAFSLPLQLLVLLARPPRGMTSVNLVARRCAGPGNNRRRSSVPATVRCFSGLRMIGLHVGGQHRHAVVVELRLVRRDQRR